MLFSYLQPLDESHLDAVFAIEQANDPTPWSKAGFERALHQGINYVFCDVEDNLLGFCCLLPVVDSLDLLKISVAKEFQNQGVASAALQAVQAKFASTQYQSILLEVRRSNLAARHLYQKLGFAQDGIRKNYYQNPDGTREDAVLMSCLL